MIGVIFFALMVTFVQSQIFPLGNFGVTGLSLQNIVMYLAAIVLVSIAASRGSLGRVHIPGFWYLVVIAIVVTMSVVLVGQYGAVKVDFLTNAKSAKNFVVDPFLLYMMSFLLVQNERQGMKFLSIFVMVLGLINLISLAMAALNISVATGSELYEGDSRFAGFTGNANKTAYLLCAVFPIQYFFARFARTKAVRWGCIILMLGAVVTVLLSGSRGGLLGLGVVAFLTARLWGDYKRLVIIPAIVLPIAMAVMIAAENDYVIRAWERIALLGSEDLTIATSSRADIWAALLDAYVSSARSVLIGNGYGVTPYIGFGARSHNFYLMILVEFGAIGFALWLMSIFRAVWYVKWIKVGDQKTEKLKKSILICMYLILISWIFTTLVGVQELLGMLFGLSIAVLISKPKRQSVATIHATGPTIVAR